MVNKHSCVKSISRKIKINFIMESQQNAIQSTHDDDNDNNVNARLERCM